MDTFTAENELRETIEHYILLPFNFPFEAQFCIPSLKQAIELLLRKHLERSGATLDRLNMKKLVEGYDGWDLDTKECINQEIKQLADYRNYIVHEGRELPWDVAQDVAERLRKLLPIAGDLYINLGNDLKIFTPLEGQLLSGQDPDWKNLSEALSQAAIKYSSIDQEISVEIANAAFEIALRGFASSWQHEGADTLPMPELISAMNEYDDESAPYYYNRQDTADTYRHLSPESFNKTLAELDVQSKDGDVQKAAYDYAQEVRELVISYLERALIIEGMCINEKWEEIVVELRYRAPDMEIPAVSEYWKNEGDYSYFLGEQITIKLDRGIPEPAWDDDQWSMFHEVVEDLCGKLPEGVKIKFEPQLAL